MSIKRKLIRINTPVGQPGFLGAGHIARPVVMGSFSQTDPFIILMDDMLDKKDEVPVGGPHPHAGFETVTLVLQGEVGDEDHTMKAGDFQMMTAGSGVIHTETIEKKTQMRILQLWLNLPQKNRWTKPRVQDLPAEHVPKQSAHGVAIKLYSGSLAGLTSPVQNYVPLILADIEIEAGVTAIQQIPARYNSFLYVLKGSVKVGEEEKWLHQDQVGWLDIHADNTQSDIQLTSAKEGARLVLYAAQPQGDNIISHGPFIADTSEDIQRLYQEYRQGRMHHISTVREEQKILW